MSESRNKPADRLQRRLAELEELAANQGKMKAALRDSEQRYRFLYEENPSMYFTVDTEGTVLSVNPFGAEQLGYTVSELVGQPVLEVFHPEDRKSVMGQFRICIHSPGKAFNWEFRKVHSDGHVLWVREVARAVRDRDNRIIVLIVCEDITSRKLMEEELRRTRDEMEHRVTDRTAELRVLAGRLLTAQEDERRHLAREMHDDLSQRLAGIALQASRLDRLRMLPSPEATQIVQDIREALSRLSSDVHALSRRLHPSILSDLGLVEVLESECDAFSKRGQLEVQLRTSDVPEGIDKNTAVCLYRICQEALRNIVKHAATDRARVSLTARDGALTLVIEDDGVGFDVSGERGVGIGLVSMEERARLIGAELSIESRSSGGSRVRVRVPESPS